MFAALSECNDYSILQEIKTIDSNPSTYKIRGSSLLQTLNEINGNRRIYSHAIGEIYVDTANKKIGIGRLLGEQDHPWIANPNDPNEVKRQMIVLWEKVAHKFDKMWLEGDNICGLVETLSNARGMDRARIAAIDHVPMGFSCRAGGKVKKKTMNGISIMEVVKPTMFVTYDCVTDPSHAKANMTDISEVITNANQLKAFKESTIANNSNEVVLDESNSFLELAEMFTIDLDKQDPMKALLEGFFNESVNPTSVSSTPEREEKFVRTNMTSLLSEFLSTSDKINGISNVSVLNESNVHTVMKDYAMNKNEKPYKKVSSARERIESLLA